MAGLITIVALYFVGKMCFSKDYPKSGLQMPWRKGKNSIDQKKADVPVPTNAGIPRILAGWLSGPPVKVAVDAGEDEMQPSTIVAKPVLDKKEGSVGSKQSLFGDKRVPAKIHIDPSTSPSETPSLEVGLKEKLPPINKSTNGTSKKKSSLTQLPDELSAYFANINDARTFMKESAEFRQQRPAPPKRAPPPIPSNGIPAISPKSSIHSGMKLPKIKSHSKAASSPLPRVYTDVHSPLIQNDDESQTSLGQESLDPVEAYQRLVDRDIKSANENSGSTISSAPLKKLKDTGSLSEEPSVASDIPSFPGVVEEDADLTSGNEEKKKEPEQLRTVFSELPDLTTGGNPSTKNVDKIMSEFDVGSSVSQEDNKSGDGDVYEETDSIIQDITTVTPARIRRNERATEESDSEDEEAKESTERPKTGPRRMVWGGEDDDEEDEDTHETDETQEKSESEDDEDDDDETEETEEEDEEEEEEEEEDDDDTEESLDHDEDDY